jgi:hypothetical protein
VGSFPDYSPSHRRSRLSRRIRRRWSSTRASIRALLDDKPGPLESKIDTDALQPLIAAFAREAVAGRKRLLITHSEVFPGTFASTTETAGWLLRELGIARRPVLAWGPTKTQQLSEAASGSFRLLGFAGNSAPDHVDQLHALPDWLERLDR